MSSYQEQRRSNERGSIMIMTAIFALLLLVMVGFALDVSRIYLVRAELQKAADAAALTAARELNGGTGGIDKAVNQATNVIANDLGLQTKTAVTIASVEFATSLNGSYLDSTAAKGVAPNIRFVKVTTESTSTAILFAAHVLGGSHGESREAVAGMSVPLAGVCDFFPAAVGLASPSPSPTPGPMTLKFAQGSGNTATINDKDYIVLDVDCISGNGDPETAKLAAGVLISAERCACNKIGGFLNMTPSSNFGNGGRAVGDGMNTRFGVYSNGYQDEITADHASIYPSDTNVSETITATQYENSFPTPGNGRRIIVAPMIAAKSYPANTNGEILGWGKFFLKKKMSAPNGNCADKPPCGYIEVEYLGQAQVGATGAVACASGLTTAVLYR